MNDLNIVLLIWNVTVMLIYGIDKMQARKGGRRISESSLLSCAFLAGGFGAMFGMVLFNHKTSKIKFRILVPLAAIIWINIVFVMNIL